MVTYLENSDEVNRGVNPEVNPPLSDRVRLSQAGDYPDPLAVMAEIMMKNKGADPKLSLEAAAKLAPYLCSKKGAGGKKKKKQRPPKKQKTGFLHWLRRNWWSITAGGNDGSLVNSMS